MAEVCWCLVQYQMHACSYSTLIFSACKLIIDSKIHKFPWWRFSFFKTSFISALMIAVNLFFFSSIHCCFVYLRFQRICLKLISALKEEKNEGDALSFCFVSFVLNVIVFVYNGLKQSLIQQTKPNRLLQISFFLRILRFILK